jgi:membrane-associated protease RseP (regulator of RpoE activity)
MRRQSPRFLLPALVVVLAAGAAMAGEVFLGITMDDVTPSMARALQLDEPTGVLINDVVEGSPAEAAGLQTGDIILAIGDREVMGTSSLSKVIRRHEPGDEVPIKILREGKRKTIKVTLGERENRKAFVSFGAGDDTTTWAWSADGDFPGEIIRNLNMFVSDRGFLGIVPGRRTRDQLRELGAPDGKGVVVERVIDDGAAATAGIEEGDVIVAIDGQAVADGRDLEDLLEDTESGQTVTVGVIRDRKARDMEVALGESSLKLEIGKGLKMFLPSAPDAPDHPRRFEFHGGDIADLRELESLKLLEKQELSELKDELAALKDELKKLREELREQR